MKRFICLLLCALVFLPVKAFAAVVSDGFATLHEKPWNKYQNLSISEGGISANYGWDNPPDNTALLMSSPLVVSTALYAVTNAQTAQFFIYSNYSTVAAALDGEYYLGVVARSDKNTLTRTRINSARNGVYLEVNQGWKKAFWVTENLSYKIKFIPTLTPFLLLGKGENYGLTVLASVDNENFKELPLAISEVINSKDVFADYLCYYESYSCNIPENTKFIRLELRETRGFDRLLGEFVPNKPEGSLRFAEVKFLGKDVKWGSFPPIEPPKPPEPSELPKPSEPPVTSPLPSSSVSEETSSEDSSTSSVLEDSSTSSAEETSSQSEDSSYDETTSEDETSVESDTSESNWTTDPSGDDPDLEKPTSRPNKPEKSFKIEVIEEKLLAESKKSSIKAASKVSNKSSAKASSKASSKEPAKSSKAEVLPAQPSSSEKKAENVAASVQSVEPKQRDIHEEKRMAVAGTYIAGASFILAGLIRKP